MYRDDDIDREVLRAGAAGYVLHMMRRGTKAEVREGVCVCESVRTCVRECVRACVRACVIFSIAV